MIAGARPQPVPQPERIEVETSIYLDVKIMIALGTVQFCDLRYIYDLASAGMLVTCRRIRIDLPTPYHQIRYLTFDADETTPAKPFPHESG